MQRWVYVLLLLLVVALGGYLRLVDLGGPSLWHDEIVHRDAGEDLGQQPWYKLLVGLQEVRSRTENGPIYYWFQALGMKLVSGDSGVRLFPAIFGILALPIMAVVGNLIGGRLLSLVATFLLAVSPLHVYYSREGRPYGLLMLLALVLLYALLARGSSSGVVAAYGASLVAAYTSVHCIPILLAFLALSVVFLAAAAWEERRRGRDLRSALVSSPYLRFAVGATLALGLAAALYLSRSQSNWVDFVEIRSPVFLSPLSGRAFERFLVSMSTSGHQSGPLEIRTWVFAALSVLGVIYGLRNRPREMVAICGMFLLPAVLSVMALVSVGRWYGIRYTTSALPAFLLLVGVGIVAVAKMVSRPMAKKPFVVAASAGVLVLAMALPNVAAARSDPYRKLDWRAVARFVEGIVLDGEWIVVPNSWPEICLGYYLGDSSREFEFINVDESVEFAADVIAGQSRGWLLTAGFRATGDVRAWMHRFQPVLKDPKEEMALFFFPDFVTLLQTRYEAGLGGVFEERFESIGQRFDFGGAEMMLQGRGWSYHEQNREGISYQWAMGDVAELGLPVDGSDDQVLRFRALPFMYPEAPHQSLELWFNEIHLTTVDLPRGWSEHEVPLPSTAVGEGANILFLRFSRSTVPAEVVPNSKDRRSLSAAFDFLEVRHQD